MRATSYYRYQSALYSTDSALTNLRSSGTDAQLCFALGELNRATISDRGLDLNGLDPEQSPLVKRLWNESIEFINAGSNRKLIMPCMKSGVVDKIGLVQLLENTRGHVSNLISLLGPAPRMSIR